MQRLASDRLDLVREGPPDPDHLLTDHLGELLGDEVTFATSTSRHGPFRKPVLQLIDRAGSTRGYAKLGHNAVTDTLVRREAEVLRRLVDEDGLPFDVPPLLHAGDLAGPRFGRDRPDGPGRPSLRAR